MKYCLSLILIAGLLGIGILSLASMDTGGHAHMDCVATAVQGKTCPEAPGTFGFINFHFNAVKFFSTAIFGHVVAIGFILLGLLFADVDIWLTRRNFLVPAFSGSLQFLQHRRSIPRESFINWLVLHEKRDPNSSLAFSGQF